jgi:hypothetical protein
LLFSVVVIYLFALRNDYVTLGNTSGSENGILVDGQNASTVLSDQRFTSSTNSVNVGHLSAAATSNEVIAFSNFRPVAVLSPAAWTILPDDLALSFADQIMIPVTIWMVKGPYNTNHLSNLCLDVVGIWNAERMGVGFSSCDFRDATTNPSASMFVNFNCTKKTMLETMIGKVANRINVYVVDTVDVDGYANTNGDACGTNDFVAIGSRGGGALLAHELGHNFSLTHIDSAGVNFPGFDETNIMHSYSTQRQYFTEGQLFRAHLTADSAVNSIYMARPSQLTRLCLPNDISDQCPILSKRIWADGTFPPN